MSIDEDQVSSATEIVAEGLDYPQAAVAIVAFEKIHPGIDWVNEVRAAREAHCAPAMGTYDRIDEVTALLAERHGNHHVCERDRVFWRESCFVNDLGVV